MTAQSYMLVISPPGYGQWVPPSILALPTFINKDLIALLSLSLSFSGYYNSVQLADIIVTALTCTLLDGIKTIPACFLCEWGWVFKLC